MKLNFQPSPVTRIKSKKNSDHSLYLDLDCSNMFTINWIFLKMRLRGGFISRVSFPLHICCCVSASELRNKIVADMEGKPDSATRWSRVKKFIKMSLTATVSITSLI